MTRLIEAIRAEIAELEDADAKTPGWGAAVGARLERLKDLRSELRRAEQATARTTMTRIDEKALAQIIYDERRKGMHGWLPWDRLPADVREIWERCGSAALSALEPAPAGKERRDDDFNEYGYDPTGPEAGAGFRPRLEDEDPAPAGKE